MNFLLLIFSVTAVTLLSFTVKFVFFRTEINCIFDFNQDGSKVCKPLCRNQNFGLPGMRYCHPWMSCNEILSITRREIFFQGVVKKFFKAYWNDHQILISEPTSISFQEDFAQHIEMLSVLSPSPFIVQTLGFCEEKQAITEYHPLGNALNAKFLPNNIRIRFQLCLSYVQILHYLHNHPSGTHVMCDSSTLDKTLSQYLLTNDLKLVLADLDALPVVKDSGIICGHRELIGEFVAPEQRWSYKIPYNESMMVPYDEKSDIWKIPDVCDWFLGDFPDADVLRFKLFSIHKRCKEFQSSVRPTAANVLKEYEYLYTDL